MDPVRPQATDPERGRTKKAHHGKAYVLVGFFLCGLYWLSCLCSFPRSSVGMHTESANSAARVDARPPTPCLHQRGPIFSVNNLFAPLPIVITTTIRLLSEVHFFKLQIVHHVHLFLPKVRFPVKNLNNSVRTTRGGQTHISSLRRFASVSPRFPA